MIIFDDESIDGRIGNGCATALWQRSWTSHAAWERCTDIAGLTSQEIVQLMPPIRRVAGYEAAKILGALEYVSGELGLQQSQETWDKSALALLLEKALIADGITATSYLICSTHAERFGECIAQMVTRGPVSWFDDHAHCPALAEATHAIRREVDLSYDVTPECPGCLEIARKGPLLVEQRQPGCLEIATQESVLTEQPQPQRVRRSTPPGELHREVCGIMRQTTRPPPKTGETGNGP